MKIKEKRKNRENEDEREREKQRVKWEKESEEGVKCKREIDNLPDISFFGWEVFVRNWPRQ